MNSGFSFGCDPELFLVDKDGKPVSAHDLIPGTKAEPYKCPSGAYQVDGIAAEFNTDPVESSDFSTFNANIVRVIKELDTAVKKTKPDARFNIAPVMEFDQEFADALPEEAKELGCDPDYDAYTLKPNPRPDGDRLFRTASGHLHIGWGSDIPTDNEEHMQICADFVKMLDATVGLIMTYIDRDPRRRELYGKAGAFRPKPYGVEYRTPSSVWLKNKTYRQAVWQGMNYAISRLRGGYDVLRATGHPTEVIQSIINTGDVSSAERILTVTFGQNYPQLWRAVQKQYGNAVIQGIVKGV